jgi:hypothetical protein
MRALGGTFMEITKDGNTVLETKVWYKLKITINDIEGKFALK